MQWSISEMVNARDFKSLPMCIQHHTENLLVCITEVLGTQKSHFLSWNMFSQNAVKYLRNGEC